MTDSVFTKPRCPRCGGKVTLSFTEPMLMGPRVVLTHEAVFMCKKCDRLYTNVPAHLKKGVSP